MHTKPDGKIWLYAERHPGGHLTITDESIVCEGPLTSYGFIGPIKIEPHLYESWRRVCDIAEGVLQAVESRRSR